MGIPEEKVAQRVDAAWIAVQVAKNT